MKIALIFVRDARFFSRPSLKFSRRREKRPFTGGKRHYVFGEPPLGIMYLSAVLKEADHEVLLEDQCHPDYSDDRYLARLADFAPDLVGLSYLSNMCYPDARELSRKIKSALPTTRVVHGGVFATVNADKILVHEESVDVVARGDGEGTILDLASGMPLADIAGITFRDPEGRVVKNPNRGPIADLDALPFPDRESLDINYVASLPLDVPAVIWDRPYTTIVSSRGCPFDCTYCNCPIFSERSVRVRSAENVLQELAEIERQGYGAFTFLDDNFLINPQRVSEICTGMVERGHDFKWACEGRVDKRGHGIFGDLARAGCDLVLFGIESGSQRILDTLRKRTKIAEIETAVAQARKAGIGIIHGFFIVGTPGETVEEMTASFDLAERLPLNSFNFNSLTAFRGTPLWDEAVARGLIDEERDWYKMFPVHEIYPEALESSRLFKLRAVRTKRLIRRKILRRPLDAARIFNRFLETMSVGDVVHLLNSSKSDHTAARI